MIGHVSLKLGVQQTNYAVAPLRCAVINLCWFRRWTLRSSTFRIGDFDGGGAFSLEALGGVGFCIESVWKFPI